MVELLFGDGWFFGASFTSWDLCTSLVELFLPWMVGNDWRVERQPVLYSNSMVICELAILFLACINLEWLPIMPSIFGDGPLILAIDGSSSGFVSPSWFLAHSLWACLEFSWALCFGIFFLNHVASTQSILDLELGRGFLAWRTSLHLFFLAFLMLCSWSWMCPGFIFPSFFDWLFMVVQTHSVT